MSCDVGCRHDSDPALLWLWLRLTAIALIRPLAWEPPYATGVAQEMAKKTKKKKKKRERGRETASINKKIIVYNKEYSENVKSSWKLKLK